MSMRVGAPCLRANAPTQNVTGKVLRPWAKQDLPSVEFERALVARCVPLLSNHRLSDRCATLAGACLQFHRQVF